MANLTKEQRAQKEADDKIKLEAKIKAELEEKIRAEYESNIPKSEKSNTLKKIPLDLEVPVTSNYTGNLIFVSKKSQGYSVEWVEYGMTEYMEIGELLSMRNTDLRFYKDNWIVIGDTDEYSCDDIYKFLKVDKYYENVYTPEDIDSFFTLTPNEMIKEIAKLSVGMKECIAVKAQSMINDGILDSNKKIDVLSEALKVEFTRN